jgi:hypothetical protein
MEHDPSDAPDQPGQRQQETVPPGSRAVELAVAEEPTQPALSGTIVDTTAGGVTIVVHEDRLRLVLTEHAGRLRNLGWVAPLGIFASLGATLITSDFKSTRFGLAAHTWESIFIVAVIVAGLWLAAALIFRLFLGGRKRSIDDCVRDIKKTPTEGVPRLE